MLDAEIDGEKIINLIRELEFIYAGPPTDEGEGFNGALFK